MKSRQEELSETQLLKTHCTTEDHKQDSRDDNNNITSYYNRKTQHAIILTDKSMSE